MNKNQNRFLISFISAIIYMGIKYDSLDVRGIIIFTVIFYIIVYMWDKIMKK